MKKLTKEQLLNAPLLHNNHKRPVTRRDFIGQGFLAGTGTILGPSLLSILTGTGNAHAALSTELENMKVACGLDVAGADKIPFICFDLAGGANVAGSNVLVGGRGGQLDFISSAGYARQGLPGDMVPSVVNPQTGLSDFINTDYGLAFHSDSAFLRGIQDKSTAETAANTNGAVIPARSDNDTGNNPHNPMYGLNHYATSNSGLVYGELLPLIGSQNSDSGGNSMSPASMIDLTYRPTKVDRPSDVTGLVDVGDLVGLLSQQDAVHVMESMAKISNHKLNQMGYGPLYPADPAQAHTIGKPVSCGYVKSADLADRFGDPTSLDPSIDPDIVGPSGIFTQEEFDSDSEFRKTASVMKMVLNGYAGAGTITMGGYDYHGQGRSTGEVRDFRAGRCMGACLEYAKRLGKPLMMYVFSDGSVSSNGVVDNSEEGRGKFMWQSDNSSTAASFFMVYNPDGRAQLIGGTPDEQAIHQQIGYMRTDGSTETASSPAANNPNLLVETVILNYMALHGEQNQFESFFPNHGLGSSGLRDSLTAFEPIVNGTIGG
ncbi:general secretion pathway protein GspF [Aliikangiella sp. G2MR2-5]|uniref:general secretion pathway protein GspF n=1 Tax=Aliikangiella sp. G2MR2-5 TaxID=2788943 RepID=UPI0018AC3F7E|nr:general secretion pathway protein GspF [Aliikangiella sp. G2MR2-5]